MLNRTTTPPQDAPLPEERALLRQWLDYQGERKVVGEITLRSHRLRREARLIELEDGERLLILFLNDVVCFWAPTSESVESIHRRACHWISEPPTP